MMAGLSRCSAISFQVSAWRQSLKDAGGNLAQAVEFRSPGNAATSPAASAISSASLNIELPTASMVANHSALADRGLIMQCSIGSLVVAASSTGGSGATPQVTADQTNKVAPSW